MQNFRQLHIWQRSHALTLRVYRLTRAWPKEELYGLTSQLRRSAASVPTNIAEGSKRKWGMDYARFLNNAESSLSEAQYQVLLGSDLGYLQAEEAQNLEREMDEIAAMIYSLRLKVERTSVRTLLGLFLLASSLLLPWML